MFQRPVLKAAAALITAMGAAAGSGVLSADSAMASPPPAHASARPQSIAVASMEQQGRHLLVQQPGVAPNTVHCWSGVAIYSTANGRYVSTELGYTGGDHAMLRARSTSVGPWEQYIVCRDDANGLTDMASQATGLDVSAELGFGGGRNAMLRARASSVGPWELFTSSANPGGSYTWIASNANGRFVSAELGYGGSYYGMLRARATSVGPWEVFIW
jgi:hypothetical protein